jgi:adenylate kinase family enzyme
MWSGGNLRNGLSEKEVREKINNSFLKYHMQISAGSVPNRASVVFDGPPSSGKSTRGKVVSEAVGFDFFDMGDYLRANKENIPENVQEIMKLGKGVPDEYILPILRKQVMSAPGRSRIFVGVRSVEQARELLYNLYNFNHRVIYLKLERTYQDCFDLMQGRSSVREDDKEDVFRDRWAYYESHTHDVQRFFASRGAVRVLHYTMTRSIEHDKKELLKLLEPHCENFTIPDLMVQGAESIVCSQ